MTDRFIRVGTLIEITGLSRRTIYRKMKRGEFPHSVKLSASAVGWRESEVERWLKDPAQWTSAA